MPGLRQICSTTILLALTAWNGCGTSRANLTKALAIAAHQFNSGVRWRRHQAASDLLAKPLRDAYMSRAEESDEAVNVSMVELIRTKLDTKTQRAVLRYRYHWHRSDQGILRRTIVVQRWRWMGSAWQLQLIEHGSGPKFPLFDQLAKPRKRESPRPPARRQPVPAASG